MYRRARASFILDGDRGNGVAIGAHHRPWIRAIALPGHLQLDQFLVLNQMPHRGLFAPQPDEDKPTDIRMLGHATQDAVEHSVFEPLVLHRAAPFVPQRDHPVDSWECLEHFRREGGGDTARDGSGAIDGGDDSDVVSGAAPPPGPPIALKGHPGDRLRWRRNLRSDRLVIHLMLATQIVAVNVFTLCDGLGCHADRPSKLEDGLIDCDRADRHFVSRRNPAA